MPRPSRYVNSESCSRRLPKPFIDQVLHFAGVIDELNQDFELRLAVYHQGEHRQTIVYQPNQILVEEVSGETREVTVETDDDTEDQTGHLSAEPHPLPSHAVIKAEEPSVPLPIAASEPTSEPASEPAIAAVETLAPVLPVVATQPTVTNQPDAIDRSTAMGFSPYVYSLHSWGTNAGSFFLENDVKPSTTGGTTDNNGNDTHNTDSTTENTVSNNIDDGINNGTGKDTANDAAEAISTDADNGMDGTADGEPAVPGLAHTTLPLAEGNTSPAPELMPLSDASSNRTADEEHSDHTPDLMLPASSRWYESWHTLTESPHPLVIEWPHSNGDSHPTAEPTLTVPTLTALQPIDDSRPAPDTAAAEADVTDAEPVSLSSTTVGVESAADAVHVSVVAPDPADRDGQTRPIRQTETPRQPETLQPFAEKVFSTWRKLAMRYQASFWGVPILVEDIFNAEFRHEHAFHFLSQLHQIEGLPTSWGCSVVFITATDPLYQDGDTLYPVGPKNVSAITFYRPGDMPDTGTSSIETSPAIESLAVQAISTQPYSEHTSDELDGENPMTEAEPDLSPTVGYNWFHRILQRKRN